MTYAAEVTVARLGRAVDETLETGSGTPDLLWLYAYIIGEYARHIGHADVICELIDGKTGLAPR